VAHEDHPQRALYAALRMQEEVRRYADRQRAEGRAPIQIRVGVNTGEVVVRSITTGAGQVEYTPIGRAINLASRLHSIARTGSIVASEGTPTLRRLLHRQAAGRNQSQRRQRNGQWRTGPLRTFRKVLIIHD
jgi:class 3 adenylate cyclase